MWFKHALQLRAENYSIIIPLTQNRGCANKTNVAIIQRYQSKLLRIITNAPWYVTNQTLHSDLRIQCVTSVRDEYTRKHRSTLVHHPNPVVKPLLLYNHHARRLKRRWTFDAISWGVVTGHTPGPPCKWQLISLQGIMYLVLSLIANNK